MLMIESRSKEVTDGKTDGRMDRSTDGHSTQILNGHYNIIPALFKWQGIKMDKNCDFRNLGKGHELGL